MGSSRCRAIVPRIRLAQGFAAARPQTTAPTRAPGLAVRAISAMAADITGKNIKPKWQYTASNVLLRNGRAAASHT